MVTAMKRARIAWEKKINFEIALVEKLKDKAIAASKATEQAKVDAKSKS
jgi:DNA-dependent RNA polymerase auxiliary subunit epsilon